MQNRGSANLRNSAYFSAELHADENKKNKLKHVSVTDADHGRFVFTSEAFAEIMHNYAHFTFRYRINNAIVNHSQSTANTNQFYLYWEDSQKFYKPIIVTLKHVDKFKPAYSRFFTENSLVKFAATHFNYKIKPDESFYRLDVHQRVHNGGGVYDDVRLLTMWFTTDGKIGELRHVGSGDHFSANETLRIYNYFAQFLQIQTLFIADDSELVASSANIKIPIRVISAIATGKTWLQRRIPGLTLFNADSIAVGDMNKVNQSGSARDKSLQELQALKLSDWQKQLSQDAQPKLFNLYLKFIWSKKLNNRSGKGFLTKNYEKEAKADFSKTTLQTLTAAIYDDAKNKKEITDELALLNDLLCGNLGLDFGTIPLNKKAPDHWVKSRVRDLMWGSYIWKHRIDENLRQSRDESFTTGSFTI